MERIRLVINLPSGFYASPALTDRFADLEAFADCNRMDVNSADDLLPALEQADAVLMWSWPRLDSEQIARCTDLMFAGHLDIRPDHARALLERGIAVSTGRSAWAPAVAEMALTLMLSTLRRTPSHQAAMWQGTETWVRKFPDDIDPRERELSGRRVGLVGFGAVGRRLATLLAPFACDIRVHDPYLPDTVAQAHGIRNVSIDELARHAEILVLCASANAGSRHILGTAQLAALQPGAILVNVSRASLVDSAALLQRLQQGDLAAALDVYDQEPLPVDSPWRTLPNVYMTPHRAGGIFSSVQRILSYLTADMRAFFAGEERRYPLTLDMLSALDT